MVNCASVRYEVTPCHLVVTDYPPKMMHWREIPIQFEIRKGKKTVTPYSLVNKAFTCKPDYNVLI